VGHSSLGERSAYVGEFSHLCEPLCFLHVYLLRPEYRVRIENVPWDGSRSLWFPSWQLDLMRLTTWAAGSGGLDFHFEGSGVLPSAVHDSMRCEMRDQMKPWCPGSFDFENVEAGGVNGNCFAQRSTGVDANPARINRVDGP